MNRGFAVLTVSLSSVVAFFIGLVLAGSMAPAPAVSGVPVAVPVIQAGEVPPTR
jgi:hypothetical protein